MPEKPEKKKGKGIFDTLFPVVEDGKSAVTAPVKEESEPVPVEAVTPKKRHVPGSPVPSVETGSAPTIILPASTNAEVEVFYKSILERVSGVGADYDKFQNLLTQFSPMFPGAEDKAIAAAVIAMGNKGSSGVAAAIDEKLGTLAELLATFEKEAKGKTEELAEQEKGLPSADQDIANINQQIEDLRAQVSSQIATLQKRIDALNQQKEIIAKKVQEGRAKLASAQGSFTAAVGRAQREFEAIKSKVSNR
jgi:archaellum component FlaC